MFDSNFKNYIHFLHVFHYKILWQKNFSTLYLSKVRVKDQHVINIQPNDYSIIGIINYYMNTYPTGLPKTTW